MPITPYANPERDTVGLYNVRNMGTLFPDGPDYPDHQSMPSVPAWAHNFTIEAARLGIPLMIVMSLLAEIIDGHVQHHVETEKPSIVQTVVPIDGSGSSNINIAVPAGKIVITDLAPIAQLDPPPSS